MKIDFFVADDVADIKRAFADKQEGSKKGKTGRHGGQTDVETGTDRRTCKLT